MARHPRGTLPVRLRHRFWSMTSTDPSFAQNHAERRRVRRAAADLGFVEPVWAINAKQDAYRWADAAGVRRPATLASWAAASEVDWDALPQRFVLKPDAGAGGKGVLLLERRGDHVLDLLRQCLRTREDVTQELSALALAGRISPALSAEELVQDAQRPGGPPVDWKFYTFFGVVGLVLARAPALDDRGREHHGWRMFDSEWRDLGDAYAGHPPDTSIALPVHRGALFDLASRLSGSIPRPFMRIDLYDGPDGPVFGEITPEPGGGQRFRRDVDRELGALWEHAEARLLVRAGRAGVLDTATAPLAESALERPPQPPR